MNKFIALDFPVHVNFDLTYKCNAGCSFCYIVDRYNNDYIKIDLEKINNVIRLLAENGVLRINFFGGEPLLIKELPEILFLAKMYDIRTTLITNGLLLSKSLCEVLSDRIDTIAVSIHGLGELNDRIIGIPNSFEKLMNNLTYLQDNNIDFGINYTVLENNSYSIIETLEFLLDRFPIKYVSANRFVGGHDKNDLNQSPSIKTLNYVLEAFSFLHEKYPNVAFNFAIYFPLCLIKKQEYKKFMKACGMGINYCSVDYSGNIRLCSFSNHILSNIFEEDIKYTWNNNNILTNYRQAEWLPKPCKECSIFSDCLVGCKVSNPQNVFGPDILLELNPYK